MQIRAEFIDYIRRVENGSKVGYDSGVWSPHPSPEGGNDTIGYGHKMRNDEEWMKAGVPDEHIENLLLNDIIKAALTDDKEIMTKEYKRYYRNGSGELKELEHRNAEFARMFL